MVLGRLPVAISPPGSAAFGSGGLFLNRRLAQVVVR